jgi:membrane fusion protein (multidrug efflux system)
MNATVRFALAAALAAGGMACSSPEPESGAGSLEPAVPVVETTTPSTDVLALEIRAPGSFLAKEEATVSAEAAGTVAKLRALEGDKVSKGQVLVQLKTTKAELAVKQAEAGLAQARANFERAKSELARKQQLLEDRTIAQGTFDAFKAQHDAAAAAVDGAESGLALARQRLQDMTITAPFAGVVKDRSVSVGEYVRDADPVVEVIQIDPLKLRFEVPEKHAARLQVGQKVTTSVSARPGEVFEGRVRTIFPTLDPHSRTVRVEAEVSNPEHHLKPGFYASVRVPLAPMPNELVIPRSALLRREGIERVLVVREDRAEAVTVVVGAETSGQISVVSGLSPSDRVIVAGAEGLRSGDPVRVAR